MSKHHHRAECVCESCEPGVPSSRPEPRPDPSASHPDTARADAAEETLLSLRTCEECGCRYDRANGAHCRCGVQRSKANREAETARADAAEQLLAGVLRSLEHRDPHRFAVVTLDNAGLASWWTDWQAKHDRARRLADLTARRERERAALAATERELEALTR